MRSHSYEAPRAVKLTGTEGGAVGAWGGLGDGEAMFHGDRVPALEEAQVVETAVVRVTVRNESDSC